jgi:hypothetical protein
VQVVRCKSHKHGTKSQIARCATQHHSLSPACIHSSWCSVRDLKGGLPSHKIGSAQLMRACGCHLLLTCTQHSLRARTRSFMLLPRRPSLAGSRGGTAAARRGPGSGTRLLRRPSASGRQHTAQPSLPVQHATCRTHGKRLQPGAAAVFCSTPRSEFTSAT